MTTDEWLSQAAALAPSDRARLASRLLALQDSDPATAHRWMDRPAIKSVIQARAAQVHIPDEPHCGACGRAKDLVEQLVGMQGVFLCGECCQHMARLVAS